MADANFTCFGSEVSLQFDEVSVPVIAAISVISVLLNAFNILIFSKKKMVSPTNTILLGIAVSDMIKVLMFLVTSVVPMGEMSRSYRYQAFYLFCNVAMYLMHAFALWCGVLLALFRFFYLRYYASSRTKIWFSLSRARLAVCLAFLGNLVTVAPYASSLRIAGTNVTTANATSELIEYSATLDTKHEFKIRLFNGLAQKVLPCLIMTCFCFFIIKSLRQTEKRRESLVNLNSRSRNSEANNRGGSRRGCESVCTNSDVEPAAPQPMRKRPSGNSRRERRSRDHRRTTSFLLVIIVLYILYEIPMSLLNILEDPILGLVSVQCFFRSFIGMLNTLGLVNNSVNFVLYCFMSKQFREVFKAMFGLVRCLPPKNPGAAAAATAATAGRCAGRSPTSAVAEGDREDGQRWERHRTDSSRSGGGDGGGGGCSLAPMSASLRSHDDERSCCSGSNTPSNVFSEA